VTLDEVDLLGRAEAETTLYSGGRTARAGGAACVRYDLPQPWATKACFTAQAEPPTSAQLAAARDWLDAHSPDGWRVVVREAHADAARERADLALELSLQLWATGAAPGPSSPPGLQVEVATTAADVLTAYGAELEPLVRGRIGVAGDTWLVGREAGAVVACARVRVAAGTAYVSAVTVLPAARGRGIGRAISAEATRLGLRSAELAWLECDPDVSPLYAGLGYRRVTAHVQLGPR
jgi:GNAT superfamily N-acetyltransferase